MKRKGWLHPILTLPMCALFAVCIGICDTAWAETGDATEDTEIAEEELTEEEKTILSHEAVTDPKETEGAKEPEMVEMEPPPLEEETADKDSKPTDSSVWAPGYWKWDAKTDLYVWIPGIWREPPPGLVWRPGQWEKTGGGYVRVPGYWGPKDEEQVVLVAKAPPKPKAETRPPKPGDGYEWVGGHWSYTGTMYAWVPGAWQLRPNADLRWVGGRWVRTPNGYRYVPGRWDDRRHARVPGWRRGVTPPKHVVKPPKPGPKPPAVEPAKRPLRPPGPRKPFRPRRPVRRRGPRRP